jgi:hypothetical protein
VAVSSGEARGDLGEPDIRLGNLVVWVHGWQNPDSTDYSDGNWLRATAHCGAAGAQVDISGAFLHALELARWSESCRKLGVTLSGEAGLEAMEPDLSVKMRGDGLGYISVEVEITPDHLSQQHHFEFGIDQTYLPALVGQLERVLVKYPVRGAARESAT